MTYGNVISTQMTEPFIDDRITAILRNGARTLLAKGLEAKIELYKNQYNEIPDDHGLGRDVRNGISLSVKF